MNHPPTQCIKFLDEKGNPLVVTSDDIDKAIGWYETNWMAVSMALPVTVWGTVYTVRWQERFDNQTLPLWRDGKLRLNLAVAYVYAALRRLCTALKSKAKP